MKNNARYFITVTAFLSLFSSLFLKASYAEPARFMGAGSCSSSNCHGSVSPRDTTTVLQNEYITWQKKDSHAKAWSTLLNAESKQIGKHLNISNPEKDPLCLSCHATYVENDSQHGDKFRVEDGVSCESCHGPAEKWIASHTSKGATHQDNIENGMLSISNPTDRAQLCVSCHLGNKDKSVTHRLIGAGHPRLTFELDTFGMIQPRHWQVDKDYIDRKGEYHPVRAWLIGQLESSRTYLERLIDPHRSRAGAWPELTIMNCYSCHHSLTEDQWKTHEYGGKPGELRINLAPIIVLENALEIIKPAVASQIAAQREQIESKYGTSPGEPEAQALLQTLNGAVPPLLESLKTDASSDLKLLNQLLRLGSENRSHFYETAEQIAMGASAIISHLAPDGTRYQAEVNRLYQSLGQPEEFKPRAFSDACEAFLKTLKSV